ncbi:hypothetical protein Xen7305DRAFT_00045450 [Xenococcus sp. PCC 7305]|uniref:hypothetical protein n=1 Tax=Xenococcus sp. PCC 7305 TaxID=102125 RepID=UPI0002AC6C58|nr:hypothetical protein [Xenococcus sp. PCC 7305]ELS04809.1 hypothetical protein Xen7305DRAFT_00045450 [Xenococcus sp. PCC 7305]
MAIFIDAANSNNWVSRYSTSLQGEEAIVPGNYKAIPDLVVPITFEGELIAIQASSTKAKPTWKTAGWVWQRLLVNIGTGSTVPNSVVQGSQKFYLDRLNTLVIPKLSSNYGLAISIPSWLPQLDIEIYEYVGEVKNSVDDKLDQLQADLTALIAATTGSGGGSGGTLTPQQQTSIVYFSNFL